MQEAILSSRQNPRVKALRRLADPSGRSEARAFLVEGLSEILSACTGYKPLGLFFCPEKERPEETRFRQEWIRRGDPATEISLSVLTLCAYRNNPTGLLAQFETASHRLGDLPQHGWQRVILLAGLEKPGNIGAIARTARAAGVDLMGFVDPRTDLFNPNIFRASRGHWFHLPKAVASPGEWLEFFRLHGIRPFRAVPEGAALYWDVSWDSPSALLFGEEHAGLDPKWNEWVPNAVTIPMQASVDSLNVSVSAALLLYEIARQSRQFPLPPAQAGGNIG